MIEESVSPFEVVHEWLEKEKKLGSPGADRVVLATATSSGIPHSRIVAIREFSPQGLVFFTQEGTKKVLEMNLNPQASMTLWLPLQQRQVIFEGPVKSLSKPENEKYWNALPQDRQLKFCAYAPTSGKPIPSLKFLEDKLEALTQKFANSPIQMSEHYRGFQLTPDWISFYTLGTTTFSEVTQWENKNGHWKNTLVSP